MGWGWGVQSEFSMCEVFEMFIVVVLYNYFFLMIVILRCIFFVADLLFSPSLYFLSDLPC